MSDVAIASNYARRLVEQEARASNLGMREAAQAVARSLKVSAGSVWSLLYAPPKRIGTDLFRKLHDRVERSLQFELQALEHELSILRQTGADPRSTALGEVEALLAQARRALGR